MRKELLYTWDVPWDPSTPEKRGVVAQGYRAGNFVFMGGQTGFDLDGTLTGIGDPGAQTRQALENIARLMNLAGGSLRDVVKITIYVTDYAYRAQVYPVIAETFAPRIPASTGVVVKALAGPELLTELDAWAVIDGNGLKKELLYTWNVSSLGMLGSRGEVAQGYRAGNFVFMGGQTAFDLDGVLTGIGDPAAQARQALVNIKRLMELAGGTTDDVVKRIVYVTDRGFRPQVYRALDEFFRDPKPGSTGIVACALARPELLMEIDAWGVIDGRGLRKEWLSPIDVSSFGMHGSGIVAQGCRAGNFVFMGGQAGFQFNGRLIGIGDPAAQARQALVNIKQLMELAGGSLRDVVKVIVYVTKYAYRAHVYPIIAEAFPEPRPASTGIVVKGLARPELLMEIDAWGIIDD
jgi:enamine deaminase RidA (YjgF/YER057c/UK114 family)